MTDAAVRAKPAEIYKESFNQYWAAAEKSGLWRRVAGPYAAEALKITESARYMVDHFQDVSAHVLFA